MPSEVWQYFDEFDGGAKCKLCGCVRNRKDKSTSTFWQHLKKVHQIMQPKSPHTKSVKNEAKMEITNYDVDQTLDIIKRITSFDYSSLFLNDNDQKTTNIMESTSLSQKDISENPSSVNSTTENSICSSSNIETGEFKKNSEHCKNIENIFNFYNLHGKSHISDSSRPSSSAATAPVFPMCQEEKRQDYIDWDEFFMGSALLAAQRSKDPVTQVGAVLANTENIIIGIGYNGMPFGCSDDVFPWGKTSTNELDRKFTYVCHAEMNAILNKNMASAKGTTIYCTMFPCNECAKIIIQVSSAKYFVFCRVVLNG